MAVDNRTYPRLSPETSVYQRNPLRMHRFRQLSGISAASKLRQAVNDNLGLEDT
jgi:hypothetical protein